MFFASWARGEPTRGGYDDAELARWRKAALATRRGGSAVWVVAHAGALPEWQVGRGGWTDPDVLANWGCWIDRLGRALLEGVDGWIALWDPLGEAACYDADARRVGRVLLDAQAVARLELHRGAGSSPLPVGAAVPVPRGLREGWKTRTWLDVAASGKLKAPWALGGELPNGTPALDTVAVIGPGDGRVLVEGRRAVRVGNAELGTVEVAAEFESVAG